MLKRVLVPVALLLAVLLAVTGCGVKEGIDNAVSAVAQRLSGNVQGEVGKTYATQWFTFTVKSIDTVYEYAGYAPSDGMQLIDVVVEETNTFDEDIPMGTFDFYLDANSFPDYVYPIDPLDTSMMPDEFALTPGETVEYHMVYEIPADESNLKLYYTEFNESGEEGTTFHIPFTV